MKVIDWPVIKVQKCHYERILSFLALIMLEFLKITNC